MVFRFSLLHIYGISNWNCYSLSFVILMLDFNEKNLWNENELTHRHTNCGKKNPQWNDRTSTKYFPSNESGLKRHFSMTKKINFQKQHIHLDSMHQKIMWCSFLTVTYLCSTIWSLSLAFFGEKNHEALFCLATLSKPKNPSRKTIWTASNKLTILVKVVEVKMNRHTHMQNTQKNSANCHTGQPNDIGCIYHIHFGNRWFSKWLATMCWCAVSIWLPCPVQSCLVRWPALAHTQCIRDRNWLHKASVNFVKMVCMSVSV